MGGENVGGNKCTPGLPVEAAIVLIVVLKAVVPRYLYCRHQKRACTQRRCGSRPLVCALDWLEERAAPRQKVQWGEGSLRSR